MFLEFKLTPKVGDDSFSATYIKTDPNVSNNNPSHLLSSSSTINPAK